MDSNFGMRFWERVLRVWLRISIGFENFVRRRWLAAVRRNDRRFDD